MPCRAGHRAKSKYHTGSNPAATCLTGLKMLPRMMRAGVGLGQKGPTDECMKKSDGEKHTRAKTVNIKVLSSAKDHRGEKRDLARNFMNHSNLVFPKSPTSYGPLVLHKP